MSWVVTICFVVYPTVCIIHVYHIISLLNALTFVIVVKAVMKVVGKVDQSIFIKHGR